MQAKQRPISVLVIDTGVDHKHSVFDNYKIVCPHTDDCTDFWGHGTHVASLVLNGPLDKNNKPTTPVCANVTLYSCDYKPKTGYRAPLIECLEYAKKLRPDFVNFSSVGNSFVEEEYEIYADLKYTTFVVAAGNESDDLKESPLYPAVFPRIKEIAPKFGKESLSNVITVGARTTDGTPWTTSNRADFLVYEIGVNINSAFPQETYEIQSGTSMATAIRTNRLLREKCNE